MSGRARDAELERDAIRNARAAGQVKADTERPPGPARVAYGPPWHPGSSLAASGRVPTVEGRTEAAVARLEGLLRSGSEAHVDQIDLVDRLERSVERLEKLTSDTEKRLEQFLHGLERGAKLALCVCGAPLNGNECSAGRAEHQARLDRDRTAAGVPLGREP